MKRWACYFFQKSIYKSLKYTFMRLPWITSSHLFLEYIWSISSKDTWLWCLNNGYEVSEIRGPCNTWLTLQWTSGISDTDHRRPGCNAGLHGVWKIHYYDIKGDTARIYLGQIFFFLILNLRCSKNTHWTYKVQELL